MPRGTQITFPLFDNEYILIGTIDRSANYKFYHLSLYVILKQWKEDLILYLMAFVITRVYNYTSYH